MDSAGKEFRCAHYRRRCKIRAPCCGEIFDCRHCHNEAMNSLEIDAQSRHDIPRHEVEKVICSLCNTEQNVQQNCSSCGVCMGNYFCNVCKFFDDDIAMILTVVGMVVYSWAVEDEKVRQKVMMTEISLTEELKLIKEGVETKTLKDIKLGENNA